MSADIETITRQEIPTNGNFVNFLEDPPKRFNKLIVIGYYGIRGEKHFWLCKCDCGNETISDSNSLNRNLTKSCGCLKKEFLTNLSTKHNKCQTEEYRAWQAMKSRCLNENNKHYHNYGGRGITVCKRWLDEEKGFENFYEDIGEKPKPKNKYSLDRIDNNGNYCKENCKWSSKYEQDNNQRKNIKLEYNNKTLTIAEWSRELNISYMKIYHRVKDGLSIEQIVSIFSEEN